MKEVVVISGKGGTGKTSLVASCAALSGRCVLADCDVDAADLHLVFDPAIVSRHPFSGGKRARIKPGHCTACGKCEELCRFDAIFLDGPGNGAIARTFRVDPLACEGCGVCAWFCAEDAIEFEAALNGEWYVSETRCGPMVHARLGVAEENSGKLVAAVRANARKVAEERGIGLVLIDGSPGIGCPVIASITGADLVVAVTEPTVSGLHDIERVADLTHHFRIPLLVCVNKWDLNPEMCGRIEEWAAGRQAGFAGRVRYDRAVTQAQIARKSLVEFQQNGCAAEIRAVWQAVQERLSALDTEEAPQPFVILNRDG